MQDAAKRLVDRFAAALINEDLGRVQAAMEQAKQDQGLQACIKQFDASNEPDDIYALNETVLNATLTELGYDAVDDAMFFTLLSAIDANDFRQK